MATSAQVKAFIQELGKLAVAESNRRIAEGKGFVLPSVCIAQSAIESGWGTAPIMVKANAYFGIKAGSSWTGKVFNSNTQEVTTGGTYYNAVATFRAYDSKADSVRDYYDLIGNLSRYSKGLSFGSDRSQWLTARQCITAIWAGGYTPEQTYVEKIMNTINARKLTDYDKLVTGTGVILPDGSVSIPQLSEVTKIYTKADLLQGILVPIDSGRAIENDTENLKTVALDWNKAIDVKVPTTFTLEIDKKYAVNILTLQYYISDGELPEPGETTNPTDTTQLQADKSNGDKISIGANTKVGFYIHLKNDTPIPQTELSLASIPDNFQIAFVSDSLPPGEESYSTPIAVFVKIE